MRGNYIALAAASMMVLASCGSKKLSLSNDPIDKAATCAVVSAADARLKAPDGKGDLDFEAQTRIIHYAMLAGAQGQDFSAARASAVVTRMNALQEDITSNKWKDLIEPCDRAIQSSRRRRASNCQKTASMPRSAAPRWVTSL